ncbi:hypothetical protein CUJ84_pRLN3000551 (plasmid) [Rhizobium leguminosarum]|uniref:Uncharacterized protein n=1 Tax=Rhizobium leguminosarum TaxID=384 RepID=A0A2K9ZHF7_RHILE|nr:hypothetical protein CUJ84_pRLN3000551 [Rhizobium leguminosarum]
MKTLPLDERALFLLGDTSTGRAFARLAKAMIASKDRESAKQAESHPNFLSKRNLGPFAAPSPLPDDAAHARAARAADVPLMKTLPLDEQAPFLLGDTSTGRAFARLAKAMIASKDRESAKQAESHPNFLSKRNLGPFAAPSPLPDDAAHARAAQAEEIAAHVKTLPLDEQALFLLGDTSTGRAFARLAKAMIASKEREAAKQAESHPNFLSKRI